MIYRKIPQCRICQSREGDKIDKDLIARATKQTILDRYRGSFTTERPLTLACINNHWKHLKKAMEDAALGLVQTGSLDSALSEALVPHDRARQQVFSVGVQQQVQEIHALEALVLSTFSDLQQVSEVDESALTDDEKYAMINRRDRLRISAAGVVHKLAQVKQMALESHHEHHEQEKGRLVFRMLELFRKVLLSVPQQYHPDVTADLKDRVRDDDEINGLLKRQASVPVTP